MLVNLTDLTIMAIALLSAVGAYLLLRPFFKRSNKKQLRTLIEDAEADKQRMSVLLQTMQTQVQEATGLRQQLNHYLAEAERKQMVGRSLTQTIEETATRARKAESGLQQLSDQFAERIEHVQTYWDEQLNQTATTVREVHSQLSHSLQEVDAGMQRLHEQERMAQSFMQKLLAHQKNGFAAQQENLRLSTEINARLEGMLNESARSLLDIQTQQRTSNELFANFSADLQTMEQALQAQYGLVNESSERVSAQVEKSLAQMQTHLQTMQQQEADSTRMNQHVHKQVAQVDALPLDRLTRTVDITDEMCADLQVGLENAHRLLQVLEQKTVQVLDDSELSSELDKPISPNAEQQKLYAVSK